jgi:hypothetical protein
MNKVVGEINEAQMFDGPVLGSDDGSIQNQLALFLVGE